jgi:hypothetical protein
MLVVVSSFTADAMSWQWLSDSIRVGYSSAFVVFSSYALHNAMRILLQLFPFAPVPWFSSLTEVPSSVSFSQLQKQIIDLATTHFVHLPVRPPAEDLAQVPSNLPSFLGDTAASRYDFPSLTTSTMFTDISLDKCALRT